jgi:hypothetical protein
MGDIPPNCASSSVDPHAGWEWEISFTLAAGYDEDDACELYERIETSPRVSGAALSGASPEHTATAKIKQLREALRVAAAALEDAGYKQSAASARASAAGFRDA